MQIDSEVFWKSTPKIFNGLIRGSYKRLEREGNQMLSQIKGLKKDYKLENYLGFKLYHETPTEKATKHLTEEERLARTDEELSALKDLFNSD